MVDRLATVDMGRKLEGYAPFGELAPHVAHVVWAEAYLCIKWHLDLSSRLVTIDMGRKLGVLAPVLGRGELGSHLTQCRLGLPPYQVAS